MDDGIADVLVAMSTQRYQRLDSPRIVSMAQRETCRAQYLGIFLRVE